MVHCCFRTGSTSLEKLTSPVAADSGVGLGVAGGAVGSGTGDGVAVGGTGVGDSVGVGSGVEVAVGVSVAVAVGTAVFVGEAVNVGNGLGGTRPSFSWRRRRRGGWTRRGDCQRTAADRLNQWKPAWTPIIGDGGYPSW